LVAVGPRGWRDLASAQVALVRAERRLRREPLGSLVSREAPEGIVPSGDASRARERALAVERAATRGIFRPFCLARALALRELLLRHGIEGASIRVGVRRDAGKFMAHAWVRWGDEVLGDRPWYVARFTEVDDIRVLGRR
jgi:hypothetical protein